MQCNIKSLRYGIANFNTAELKARITDLVPLTCSRSVKSKFSL